MINNGNKTGARLKSGFSLIIGGAAGLICLILSPPVPAYTPVGDPVVMVASVTVLGRAQIIAIQHTPLQGLSVQTNLAIIKGSVSKVNSTTVQGFRAAAPRAPLGENEAYKITVDYRFVSGTDDPDPSPPGRLYMESLNNPASFAFQIPKSSITSSAGIGKQILEYRIEALLVTLNGGVDSLLSGASLPSIDPANPTKITWVPVKSSVFQAPAQASPESGGRYSVLDGNPDDGQTTLDVPASGLGAPTQISITEIGSADCPALTASWPSPVSCYRLSDTPLKSSVLFTGLYEDFAGISADGEILQSGTVQADGKTYPENSVSLVVWDGFNWKNAGGIKNGSLNTVTARIGMAPYVALVPLGPPAAPDVRPMQKILLPYGSESANHKIDFTGIADTHVEIFDVNGHRVRSIYPDNPSWDGRDDSGQVVESGVYIYQYKMNGELVSGVIAVAK